MIIFENIITGKSYKCLPKGEKNELTVSKLTGKKIIKQLTDGKEINPFTGSEYRLEPVVSNAGKVTHYAVVKQAVSKSQDCQELEAEYFDHEAIHESPETLYRVDKGSHRFYYKKGGSMGVTLFPSVTTVISQTLPTPEPLIQWRIDQGDNYREELTARAEYGTFMHIIFAQYLIDGEMNLDQDIENRLRIYCEKCKYPRYSQWLRAIREDLLAFTQWVQDYKVKPLAIEVPLFIGNEHKGVASVVDLLCEITVMEKGFWGEQYKSGAKKGQPKETKKEVCHLAIVDHKSTRKGFHDTNEIQLEFYKALIEENFPQLTTGREVKLYNWGPKSWRGESPSYNFADQTGKHSWEKCDQMLQLHRMIKPINADSIKFREITGSVFLDSDVRANIINSTLGDIVKNSIMRDEDLTPAEFQEAKEQDGSDE